MSQGYSRRDLLKWASAAAVSALAQPAVADQRWITAKPRFISNPFTLGVASGDPMPDGVVLWTRLAPNPLDPMSAGGEPIPVIWEVAADDKFRKPVRSGAVVAYPENAHSVHVDVTGLSAGRPYYYRFITGDEISPVGRTVTSPAVMAATDRLRFAVASCQQYEMGYFKAYRDMIAQDVDLIVHLGDYIYENTWNGPVRRVPVGEARTLDAYRAIHATYKLDRDLQAGHAHAPFMTTWDDHEVVNDYAAEFDEDYEPPASFLKRRAAAYKAYYEHLPLRAATKPNGADMQLYRRFFYGDLMEINMLDTRQYRTDHPCQTPEEGGWQRIDGQCAERFDAKRTILGEQQERWFLRRYGRQGCKWNVMAQGMLFSKHDMMLGDGEQIGSEYWDGYVASRNRVLETIDQRQISNPVCIGGDVHATYVCDIKQDFDQPDSKTIASEFVCTSVTSPNGGWPRTIKTLPENPHIKLYEGRYRGYTLMDMTHKRLDVQMRDVGNVMVSEDTPTRTVHHYVVEDGVAGPQKA